MNDVGTFARLGRCVVSSCIVQGLEKSLRTSDGEFLQTIRQLSKASLYYQEYAYSEKHYSCYRRLRP